MPRKITDSGFRNWKPSQLPDLSGKTYFITGGNSGIGYEAARMLGVAGADLLIASRNKDKGKAAVLGLQKATGASVDLIKLDLASLSSVRKASDKVRQKTDTLDGLINNAGIMQTPQLQTADGFEMQLGTNHLGHFLLDGLLFDLVEAAKGRIVTVASIAHKFGRMHFDDLMMSSNYNPSQAYGQSKLANLLYALELDRRLKASGSAVTSYACHPGYSNTALQSTGPTGALNGLYKIMNPLLSQAPSKGAIPTVLCAAGKEAVPGGYYGPQSAAETRGRVSDATVSSKALNEKDAQQLWAVSEELVGFSWDSVLA
jgi:NAD(P)-dependent dehydrogenase (short-subunit alcohol dehydrogenase family)